MEPAQAVHGDIAKVVERAWRNGDLNWDMPIPRRGRFAGRFDFDRVIATRLVIGLQTPRDIGYARVRIRLLEKVLYLSTQSVRVVNTCSGKGDIAKEILASLVDRDHDIDHARVLVIVVSRFIDCGVEIPLRHVGAMNKVGAFFDIRGDKGKT